MRTSVHLIAGWGASLAAEPNETGLDTTRPWTRWWWLGNAVDEAGLTRQLESFAASGIGGVEITPIYGVNGAEGREVAYLSPRWMALLEHTGREAKRLGLGVDMATGTGWPFGGPWIPPEFGSQRLELASGALAGTPTGMKVKRAAPGAEGLVINPYSVAALDQYLNPFSKAFSQFSNDLLRSQFHDSFEYYNAEWSPEVSQAFRKQHGYSVEEHLEKLLLKGEASTEDQARLRADYRATLAELHLAYLRRWKEWSNERGWLIRNQSHGAPANLLDLYGTADIPETETFGSTPFPIPGIRREWTSTSDVPEPLVLRMASSAAHVMGRPLASSETCTWLREHWQESLAFVKPEIDRLFVSGINHILYHGTAYSPPDAPWPGWLFYASTQFNPQNPLWRDMPALNAYVTRVQTVLQGGEPDQEVLLYWPFHDALHQGADLVRTFGVHNRTWLEETPFERDARALLAAGHGVDFISDEQLQASSVQEKRLQSPGGRFYAVLVVPEVTHMPVATLAKLLEFVRAGARIVFTSGLPKDVPGFGMLDERRGQLRRLKDAPEFKQAASFEGTWLERLGAVGEPAASRGLEFIRRKVAGGHDYFVVNLGASTFDDWLPFAKAAESARVIDPLDGRSGKPELRTGTQPAVRLRLEPGRSLIVSLRNQEMPADLPNWDVERASGQSVAVNGPWEVKWVEGGPELPAPLKLERTQPWSELPGATEAFSGTAVYSTDLRIPPYVEGVWELDLGEVRESARVRINGIEIGTSWSEPRKLRVTKDQLNAGVNRLEIEVTSLAANRIRDLDRKGVEWRVMREINFVNLAYKPFDASGWPVTPSGLVGPVVLREMSPPKSP